MSVRADVAMPDQEAPERRMVTFDIEGAHPDNFALLYPGWNEVPVPTVRVHSECITGDMLYSLRCDCGPQLREAFNIFSGLGGVIIYLRQEGRGIGLKAKIDAYELQQRLGVDTHKANLMLGHAADERTYGEAAQMLKDLGITRCNLLTNNPHKVLELFEHGIEVVEVIATGVHVTDQNRDYLAAKRDDAGHSLPSALLACTKG